VFRSPVAVRSMRAINGSIRSPGRLAQRVGLSVQIQDDSIAVKSRRDNWRNLFFMIAPVLTLSHSFLYIYYSTVFIVMLLFV